MAARTRRSVEKTSAFWDSSALVPLCARQPLTPRLRELYKAYQIAVWWATPVEIASALARLARMQYINARELAESKKLAANLADEWWIVQPADVLPARAVSLIERHDLRAADALQLAAALQWCENQPHGRVFLTSDQRLQEAARVIGFDAGQL
ncbi:MAG: PIN domain-containing protein [Acidobacteriaceae bacterium]